MFYLLEFPCGSQIYATISEIQHLLSESPRLISSTYYGKPQITSIEDWKNKMACSTLTHAEDFFLHLAVLLKAGLLVHNGEDIKQVYEELKEC